jgi:hypothetical protein
MVYQAVKAFVVRFQYFLPPDFPPCLAGWRRQQSGYESTQIAMVASLSYVPP